MSRNKGQREELCAKEHGYYHFCTDGLKSGLLFNDEAEFSYGMFLIGLASLHFGLTVYAFTLMPNHIHIIISGSGSECVRAFDYLKRKISLRLTNDGFSRLPQDYWFKLVPIETPGQMRNELVYVLRNCLEKGFGVVGGYLWSSAWIYYSQMPVIVNGTPAGKMSGRALSRLLMSKREPLPSDWLVHPYLGLNPVSFVDKSLVEKLFPEPKDLQTALVKDYEAFFEIAGRLGELSEFNKREISSIVSQILQKRFEGRDLRSLSDQERGKMAIIMNRSYGLNSYQISTSIFMKEAIVRQLLAAKEMR